MFRCGKIAFNNSWCGLWDIEIVKYLPTNNTLPGATYDILFTIMYLSYMLNVVWLGDPVQFFFFSTEFKKKKKLF